jgi:phosphate transport system permease protein
VRNVSRLRRRIVDRLMTVAALACVALALIPLGSILYTAAIRGYSSMTVAFFTQNQPLACIPSLGACHSGGIANAIEGTFILVAVASLIALPAGILAGIYLSEYGRLSRFGHGVRFVADVMTGIPSIVVGIFVFALFLLLAQDGVIPARHLLSAFAGSVALAIIMIPIVARTVEEALRLVPTTLREAALALGIPRWRTILRIVLSTGRAGVVTGALLAVARAAGETAPIILLVGGSLFGFAGLDQPTAAMPLTIYIYGLSGTPNWIALAWGTALLLIIIMLGISLAARLALRRMLGGGITGG